MGSRCCRADLEVLEARAFAALGSRASWFRPRARRRDPAAEHQARLPDGEEHEASLAAGTPLFLLCVRRDRSPNTRHPPAGDSPHSYNRQCRARRSRRRRAQPLHFVCMISRHLDQELDTACAWPRRHLRDEADPARAALDVDERVMRGIRTTDRGRAGPANRTSRPATVGSKPSATRGPRSVAVPHRSHHGTRTPLCGDSATVRTSRGLARRARSSQP